MLLLLETLFLVKGILITGIPGESMLIILRVRCVVKKILRKPATKARDGINPFTGKPMKFKAKPVRNVVKIRPLKRIKDIVK